MSMSEDELMGSSTSICRTQVSDLANNDGTNLSEVDDPKVEALQESQESFSDARESLIDIDQEYLRLLKPEARAKNEKALAEGPPYSRII